MEKMHKSWGVPTIQFGGFFGYVPSNGTQLRTYPGGSPADSAGIGGVLPEEIVAQIRKIAYHEILVD